MSAADERPTATALTSEETRGAPKSLAPAPGLVLDRYTILEQVGAGGMGEVYAAYDAKLDRKVALKLLRGKNEELQMRLVREAQAMARLAHPNVVAVFDTGHVEGKLYLAMEFVRGETLRKWQKRAPRDLAELLRAYTEAGHGLAAAHAAGLVHRDFKPDNVLVAEDGRIKVTDFGIARAQKNEVTEPRVASVVRRRSSPPPRAYAADSSGSSSHDTGPRSGSLDNPVTADGILLGTPGYMAPEQFLCEPVDARTDQFSFSVALYEALYGERPFAPAGSSLERVAEATLLGNVNDAPKGSTVPAHVRRVLLRGLSARREQRYPSMRELLDDLARDPAKKRRQLIGVALSAIALAGLVTAGVVQYRHVATGRALVCKGSEQELRGIWDDARKSQLEQALLASGSPIAADTWARVERAVDAYSRDWVSMRTEACEATRVRGLQSDEAMTLRMACLERRREGIKAYVDVFTAPDKAAVEKAVTAALALTPIDGCADLPALRMPMLPPEDPAARAKVDALRPEVAAVKALCDSGKYEDAIKRATPAIKEAEAVHFRPVEAELRFWAAKSSSGAGNYKEAEAEGNRAFLTAQAGGHQQIAARASAQLAMDLYRFSRDADAMRWVELGKATLEHMGGNPELEGELELATAAVYALKQNPTEALRHDERARELWEKALGADRFEMAALYNGLGADYDFLGEFEKAAAHYQRAVSQYEKTVGPDHPSLCRPLTSLGGVLMQLGRFDEAERHFERALKLSGAAGEPLFNALIYLGYLQGFHGRYQQALVTLAEAERERHKSLGDEDPYWKPYILEDEGMVLSELGRHKEAVAAQRRGAGIRDAKYDGNSDLRAEAYDRLGISLRAAGNPGEALVYHQRALAIFLATSDPNAAIAYLGAGGDQLDLGRFADAAVAFQQGILIEETRFGKEHPDLAKMHAGLGYAQLALGRAAEAIPNLERALAIGEKARLAPKYLAEARFALAQATWKSGGSHEAARQSALAAKRDATRAEGNQTKLAGQIDAWLASHP